MRNEVMRNKVTTKPQKSTFKQREARLGYLLIAPAFLLVSAVILYPVLYNFWLSLHEVSLNPYQPDTFVGFKNFAQLLQDSTFWHSIFISLIYTFATVIGGTAVGLAVALLLNKPFKGRKIARSVVLLPYVAPVISVVFVWQYMFNPVYGVVNHTLVETVGIIQKSIDWLDNPVAALWLVILFGIWRVFPFAFMMVLARLQSIDQSLYEAASIDGAGSLKKLWHVTLPELKFVIGSLMILRFIWNFYIFDEVYLLSKQVPVVGVYAYETAFSTYDYGLAASITVILFILVMTFLFFVVRKVLKW